MRWFLALLGVVMVSGGTYLGYFTYLHNRQVLTYMAVMLVIALGGLLLFGKVLRDERNSKTLAFLGLAAALVAIFGATQFWPMAVMSQQLLYQVAIIVAIFAVGLGLLYYAVRNGKKK